MTSASEHPRCSAPPQPPHDPPAQPDAQQREAKQREAVEQLHSIRGTIDNIDAALVHMLAERFRATQRVGVLKAQNDLPPADPERERAQIRRLRLLAETSHLDPEFAEKFLNFIISEVIRHHEAISEDHQRTEES